jgi:predicted RNase H-like HicB family nuclease
MASKTFVAFVEYSLESNLYIGTVPNVPGAHTQASTLSELQSNLREVLELVFEDEIQLLDAQFVGILQITVDVPPMPFFTIHKPGYYGSAEDLKNAQEQFIRRGVLLDKDTAATFMGIALIIDDTVPPGEIWFKTESGEVKVINVGKSEGESDVQS